SRHICATDWWPGSPSRIRRALRLRGCLVREPGRGFCQDLPLFLEPPVLTAQPRELLALGASQTSVAPAGIARRLLHPLADRPAGAAELLRKLREGAARTMQLHHLTPELRRVSRTLLCHR